MVMKVQEHVYVREVPEEPKDPVQNDLVQQT